MPRPKSANDIQVCVLVPTDWVERLDTVAAKLSDPAVALTRADILRRVIHEGLQGLEAAAKVKRKR
jgi:hypothetical protein